MTTPPQPSLKPAPPRPNPRRLSLWLGLILALPLPAQADTLWICALSADQTRLGCLADEALDGEAESAPVGLAPPAPRHGTRHPLDTRQRQEVDLLGPAADLDFVEQLAQATMCGRTPRCRAWLSRPGARPGAWPSPTASLPPRIGG